jgi:hypothetical protein
MPYKRSTRFGTINKKKMMIIIGIALLVLILLGGGYMFYSKKSSFGSQFNPPKITFYKSGYIYNDANETISRDSDGNMYPNASIYAAPAGTLAINKNEVMAQEVPGYLYKNNLMKFKYDYIVVYDNGSFELHKFMNKYVPEPTTTPSDRFNTWNKDVPASTYLVEPVKKLMIVQYNIGFMDPGQIAETVKPIAESAPYSYVTISPESPFMNYKKFLDIVNKLVIDNEITYYSHVFVDKLTGIIRLYDIPPEKTKQYVMLDRWGILPTQFQYNIPEMYKHYRKFNYYVYTNIIQKSQINTDDEILKILTRENDRTRWIANGKIIDYKPIAVSTREHGYVDGQLFRDNVNKLVRENTLSSYNYISIDIKLKTISLYNIPEGKTPKIVDDENTAIYTV